jgi:hypothetical protein
MLSARKISGFKGDSNVISYCISSPSPQFPIFCDGSAVEILEKENYTFLVEMLQEHQRHLSSSLGTDSLM